MPTLTDLHFRWVDRDMYMRFIGGGVGHAETHPSPSNESGEEGIAMEMDEGNFVWEDCVAPLHSVDSDLDNGAVDGDAMEEDEDVCVNSDEPDSDEDDEGEGEDEEDDDDDDLGPDDGEEEYDDDANF
jgi:hypothetical protein